MPIRRRIVSSRSRSSTSVSSVPETPRIATTIATSSNAYVIANVLSKMRSTSARSDRLVLMKTACASPIAVSRRSRAGVGVHVLAGTR